MGEIEKTIHKIRQAESIQKINEFVFSTRFIWLVAFVTLMGNIFAIELYTYGILTVFAVYIALFGRDYLPYIPMIACCYIMPNTKNNPGRMEQSIFYVKNGGVAIIVMGVLIVLGLFVRLLTDKELRESLFKTKRNLLWGFTAVLVGYLLSGIGSKNFAAFALKNLLLGGLEFLAIALPYFLLTGMIKWKEVDKRYFAFVGVVIGLVVGFETVYCYFSNGVITDGKIDRLKIYTGWGINNNLGALISMSVPFAFYFIYKGEKVFLYNLVALALCLFAVMTCSRGAILASAVAYLGCSIYVLIKSKHKIAKYTTVGSMLCLLFALWLIGGTKYDGIGAAFELGFNSNGRFSLYKLGLNVFKESPIFGSTFYALNEYAVGDNRFWMWSSVGEFTGFIPARWHNTVIQLLASCGVVGLLAYGYHRIQSIKLFFTNVTAEKVFIGFAILILLALSLLDCHLFNLGPTMIYSCALAFAEGLTKKEKQK